MAAPGVGIWNRKISPFFFFPFFLFPFFFKKCIIARWSVWHPILQRATLLYSLERAHIFSVEVFDFVVPPVDDVLPAAAQVEEGVQVLTNLESLQLPALGTVVVAAALVSPGLRLRGQLVVPCLIV